MLPHRTVNHIIMKDGKYRGEFIFFRTFQDKLLFLRIPGLFPEPNKIPGHFQVFQDFQDACEPWHCLLPKSTSTIKDGLVRYCKTKSSRNCVNNMSILKNSTTSLSHFNSLMSIQLNQSGHSISQHFISQSHITC